MKCSELIRLLDEIADRSYAEDWDNPGLLAGDREKEIKRVLVAVDATDEVIDEAIECGADILITHHPMIFKGIKRVTKDDFTGRRIIKLIKNDIACFAMHTNFDVSCMGYEASRKLDLTDDEVLLYTTDDEGFGRIGYLKEPVPVSDLCETIKDVFDNETVRVFGDTTKIVRKAAIMPGSGSSAIKEASRRGAEVLITGDISHHDGIDAVADGLIVIDAGHFGIEKIFIDFMKEYLERNAKELEVYTDDREDPFKVV